MTFNNLHNEFRMNNNIIMNDTIMYCYDNKDNVLLYCYV